MGVVWLAREPDLDRHVAMKVLAPELAADEEFRERFLREMRLAASFDHPHVCPVYRAGEEDGLLYLALRFVPGRTLGEAIENEGSWPPERAFALLLRLDAGWRLGHRPRTPGANAVQRGRTLTLDEAVDYALSVDSG